MFESYCTQKIEAVAPNYKMLEDMALSLRIVSPGHLAIRVYLEMDTCY